MKPEDAAGEVMPEFAKHWNATIAKRNKHLRPLSARHLDQRLCLERC